MSRLIVFDMDGVLADVESSWVYVHKRFGVNNDHSLYAYLRGEITDREFIGRDIRLWKDRDPGVTSADIRRILSEIPMMPGAAETVRRLRSGGFKTAIVSAGIDILADLIAQKLPFDMQLANGLEEDSSGRLSGMGILRVKLIDKGDAVTEVQMQLGATMEDTVSVGNSRYDISMFERSRLGIAFRPSDETVRRAAGAVVEEKDLSKILDSL